MVGAMIGAVVAGSLSPDNTAGVVVMAPDALEAMHELRVFMFERVYESPTAVGQKHVAIEVIQRLVDHHLAHPELIPASYRDAGADPVTQVVDHVSGMTDRFALACTTGSSTPTPPHACGAAARLTGPPRARSARMSAAPGQRLRPGAVPVRPLQQVPHAAAGG